MRFAIIALSLILSTASYAQSKPSIEDYFQQSRFLHVDMSPDGQRLAVTGLNDPRRNTLSIYDIGSQAKPKSMPLGQVKSDWVEWATNERLVLSLTVDLYKNKKNRRKTSFDPTYGDIKVSFRRLVAVDADGKNPVTLFNDGEKPSLKARNLTRVTSFMREDPNHILVPGTARTYSLYKVNINTGLSKKVEEGGPRTWGYNADGNGTVNIRYDRDGWQTTRVLLRDKQTNKWKTITRLTFDEIKSFNPISHASDPTLMYMVGRQETEDKKGLYIYDLESEKFTDRVATHDDVDIYNVITDGSGALIATVFYTDRFEYKFIDPNMTTKMAYLRQTLGEEVDIQLSDISTNGDYWLIQVNSPRNPGAYYRFEVSTQSLVKIFDVNPNLVTHNLAPTEVITYTARDGLPLKGYLTRPPGANAQTPLIVMPHGGPVTRDYYGFDPFVQYFAARGYQVFQPNFRGGGGYGLKFKEAGHKQWGGTMQDDITDGVNHLTATNKAPKDKVCIFGISYGGFAALSGATKTPDLFQCAVSVNGVSDLMAMIKTDRKNFVVDSDSGKEMVDRIGHPRKDKAMLLERSPSENTDDIKAAIMIIDGGKDIRIDNEQANIMIKAMKASDKPVIHIHYSNSDHSLIGIPDKGARTKENTHDELYALKDAVVKIGDFFDQSLK